MIIIVRKKEKQPSAASPSLFVVNSIGRKNFGWRGVLIELTDSVKTVFKETARQLKSWQFSEIKTFILNQDNGRENNSRFKCQLMIFVE
jgi:hypothetical protein